MSEISGGPTEGKYYIFKSCSALFLNILSLGFKNVSDVS